MASHSKRCAEVLVCFRIIFSSLKTLCDVWLITFSLTYDSYVLSHLKLSYDLIVRVTDWDVFVVDGKGGPCQITMVHLKYTCSWNSHVILVITQVVKNISSSLRLSTSPRHPEWNEFSRKMYCSEFHEWPIHLDTHGEYCPYSLAPDPQISWNFEASTVHLDSLRFT